MTFMRHTAGYKYQIYNSMNIDSYNFVLPCFIQVYNIIPSISSITGISPQRYIWRIVIALHVGPRFLTSLVYHRYFLTLISRVNQSAKRTYLCYVWLALALNLIEQASLIGVTYVSNRENYRKKLETSSKRVKQCYKRHILFQCSYPREDLYRLHVQLPGPHASRPEAPQNGPVRRTTTCRAPLLLLQTVALPSLPTLHVWSLRLLRQAPHLLPRYGYARYCNFETF